MEIFDIIQPMPHNSKAWHLFIRARMMPITYFSDVYKDRVVLLYAIQAGKSIDVSLMMQSLILHSIQSIRAQLYFPLLIITLCKNAGVIQDSNEALQHPSRVLDDNLIYTMPSWSDIVQGETNSARASRPSAPRSNLTMTNRMTQLENNFQ